jgi:hypothetical protein
MELRTRNCICLGPTGNFQGTFKFFDLDTLTVIKRKKFTEFPMPDSVINKLECLGKRDKQTGRLTFADRHNVPFDWDEEYEQCPLIDDNAPEPEPTSLPFPDIPAEMPGILYESEMPNTTLLPDDPPPIAPDPDDLAAREAAAALDNANLGPREAALLRCAEIAGVNRNEPQHLQPFYNITNNNINIVRAEDDEFDPAGDDEDENDGAAPDLLQPGDDDYPDSSDDEGDDEDYEDNER